MGNKMKKIIFLLSFILYPLSLFSTPPSWFASGTHPKYQSEFYFVGIGSGDSYENAQTEALAAISRQIEVKVEGEIKNTVNSYSIGDRETITNEFQSLTKAYTKTTLINAQIVEKAEDKGKFYALAVMDKSDYLKGLEQLLANKLGELRKLYDDAENFLKNCEVFSALETLVGSGDLSADIASKSVLYASIAGKPYPIEEVLTGPAILSRVRTIIKKIEIKKISGDEQSAKSGNLLGQPFIVELQYKSDKEDFNPLRNIRLCLKDEEGKVLAKRVTDNSGKAEFWAYAVGNKKGLNFITFDLSGVPQIFKNDLKDLQLYFKFDILNLAPMSFAIAVIDETGEWADAVERNIAKSVIEAGHHVNPQAQLLLTGKVQLMEAHKIEGITGPQYLAKTELILYLKDLKSEEIFGNITLSSQGMDKTSERSALEKSYKKIDISPAEMSKLLGQAETKLKAINEKLSRSALENAKKAYSEGKYREALAYLSEVSEGEEYLRESKSLIEDIQIKLNQK
jgi:ATP-dependent protease HslVU (ClpYQ) peptidase subunit